MLRAVPTTVTDDYDAGHLVEYQKARMQPWRSRIETCSLMKRVGNVPGRSVLDVACGEGHFTRLLRLAGAAQVVAIDISERMIELARAQESAEPLGIEYRVEDVRDPAPGEDFDLVAAAWLLVFAHDRAELTRMRAGLASRLRPGGRFVTIAGNP